MVDPVTRISPSEASIPTNVGSTLAIGSEAYNAWIAARQAQINADLLDLENAAREELERRQAEGETATDEDQAHARQWGEPLPDWEEAESEPDQQTLSGESRRIGTQNFDDETPFGSRVAIL
ncbi:hypothetical protein [Ciceribacter sp. L1K22]|uniref:hypothetical protein n=1 Tax=Ciceribacter sp. L1K22 TaxID=2820275 RepID=UPI001ABE43F2|nr:hypothetical protein [Ciceribacter sp. L1K22]MBO3761151.1 hypothetical protein [Ciceribacter sp. L1K22]